MFALDFSQSPRTKYFDHAPDRFVLHSHGIVEGKNHIPHAISNVSGSGQSVSMRTWESTTGSLRVTLSDYKIARAIFRNIPRGMACSLKIGFAGWSYTDWEIVGSYQFRNLSGARNNWQMEFGDFFSSLQSKIGSATYVPLFNQAGNSTTTNGTWSVGDATLTVDNASGFKDSDGALLDGDTRGGGYTPYGLIKCTPSAGDPFYLKFTGINGAGTQITGIKAADVLDTTRVDLADENKIELMGYISDRPEKVLDKILFHKSSAKGTMPDAWNMGLSPDAITLNQDDWARSWSRFNFTTGYGYVTDMVSEKPVDDSYAFMRSYFARHGIWLVHKEGGLSMRYAEDPTDLTMRSGWAAAEITDVSIVSVENFQAWHPDARYEAHSYKPMTVTKYDDFAGGTNQVASLPAIAIEEANMAEHIFGTTNRSTAQANLAKRLKYWYLRVPCGFNLNLKGWVYASLVPGDWVRITSDMIPDFYSTESPTIDDSVYMVLSVDVDWSGFTTSIEVTRVSPRAIFAI